MTTTTRAVRRHEIDALRVLATLLLIIFHTGMVFTAFDRWHIQNVERSDFVGEINHFINQFHMPTFFLLAGMSAWYALRSRTTGTFVRERATRLFVPLIIGMLTLVPVQVYIERISDFSATRQSPIDFDGSFFAWYPNTFECCYPDANLSWHHLWFLAYLFVYSLLLVRLFKWLRGPGESRRTAITGFLTRGWNLLILPAVYLGAVEFLLRPSFPNDQNLVTDLANHANYPVVFLLGFLLVSDDRLDAVVARLWKWALPIGVAVILLPDISANVDSATRGVAEWCILIGLVGWGRSRFTQPSEWIQRFSAISLPFYIWHQTVIVVIAYWVVQSDLGVLPKYQIIATAAFFATWGLANLSGRTKATRIAFGMR